jgi:hypothetical protein
MVYAPGTTKLSMVPGLPLLGGATRTWLDVGLYAALVLSLVRALVQPAIAPAHLLPIVVLLPLCGLGDKTILLAARVEHHYAMIVCFLFAGNWRSEALPQASDGLITPFATLLLGIPRFCLAVRLFARLAGLLCGGWRFCSKDDAFACFSTLLLGTSRFCSARRVNRSISEV